MIRCTCMMLALLLWGAAFGQKVVSSEIQYLKSAGYDFNKVDLLKFQTSEIQGRSFKLEGLAKGTIISLDQDAIEQLYQDQPDFISIPVPIANRTSMVLTLMRHDIFTPDFKLFTSSDPDHPIDYTPGLHYMGVVEGDPTSIVGLSVFKDQVMAMIATDEGNMVIGRIKGAADNQHIFYNDRDLDEVFPIVCGTEDDGLEYTEEQLSAVQNSRDVNDCVRIYVEINDDIVIAKGGVIPATNYVTGIFNQSFILYANDQLTLSISEILAWTTTSPYTGLGSYLANTDLFNGDLSQLVSFDSINGGTAASLNGICNGDPDQSKCISGIRNTYKNVPLYSNSVYLVTHEMGHLLGSAHTHACVWNGNNTAIDGCPGFVQGSCPIPPIPPAGGTIMSYCNQTNSGSYLDFNLGFGPLPGNVIRNSVNAAGNCLNACGQPTSYCTSNGVNSSTEYIDKVVLNSINNLSGNSGGYGDFTSLSTSLQAGSTYTLTLKAKFTGGNNTKYWRVWIDYNQDFDWYDVGECIAQGTGNNTINLTFTVPANAATSSTRMRVAMKLAGYPSFCGALPLGEVEDYTVNIVGSAPSCSDGLLNQGEEEIDCGGPCFACPTCSDGIQNQNETGIDCGGFCPACPVGDSTILLGSYFETGMDSWTDGGPDVARVNSSNSYEGLYSIVLADNSGAQSAVTSPVFDLSTSVGLRMTFHFYAVSMESGEDFWVQYKNGSGSWTTIGTFTSGSNFNNGTYYAATVTVPNFVPTSAGSLRIQCDASDNNDDVYIDAVTIIKLNGTEFIELGVFIQEVQKPEVISEGTIQKDEGSVLAVYPNPTNSMITIELTSPVFEGLSFQIVSLTGQVMLNEKADTGKTIHQINVFDLPQGLYLLQSLSDDHVLSIMKFVKQ